MELARITAEMQARQSFSNTLGRALAEAFNALGLEGGSWSHEADSRHYVSVDVRHPSGMGIDLRHEGSHRKGREGRMLTVSGDYPREYCGWRAPSVRVSMDRDPAAMAQDIVKRFVPGYRATFSDALAAATKAERERQARIELNRRLETVLPGLTAMGGTPSHQSRDRQRSYWIGGRYAMGLAPALASGHATLGDDASTVDLQLTGVPADLALEILALINPRKALQGTVVPREIAPPVPALPVAPTVIPGELVVDPVAEEPVENPAQRDVRRSLSASSRRAGHPGVRRRRAGRRDSATVGEVLSPG
ncbi:hypothetical protein PV726_31355 [Streptomyces europaeiscabiei]|uniref:hypothetical protein n=1 Tax=Streptomyces europaeiscabiei TaxID=146819 RepID=UPI0029BF5631|nr:hypothetical protein [Streptomyces europaeiscabiei]MDX3694752.1 hypothetical protein [Streptomyces europaeiscabiei]